MPAAYYFRSLCVVSNQSVNVWSHLVGGCIFVADLALDASGPGGFYLDAYRAAAAACFLVSASYHLFCPASEAAFDALVR